MSDTLPTGEARFQAEKLVDFLRRGGDANVWWTSKDFTPKQAAAVRLALGALKEEATRRS